MDRFLLNVVVTISILILVVSCSKKEDVPQQSAVVVNPKILYFATGQCNSGSGITTFTSMSSSRMVSRVDLSTVPAVATTVLDLSSTYQGGVFAPETGVQSLVDNDASILMLTENAINTGDRKVYSIPKVSPYNTSVYISDALALTATTTNIERNLVKDTDGTLLFSKSVAIEKIGTNSLRVPMGANPWINSPAGNCATSNTFISALALMPPYTGTTTGKLIFAHQGITAAVNRLGIISNDGYAIAGNCINGYQISAVTHTNAPGLSGPLTFSATGVSPTAMVYIPTPTGPTTGKLIVAYSAASNAAVDMNNVTTLNYAIVMWSVSESSTTVAALSSPVVLYRDFTDIFGISALAYDADTTSLYVATASQPGVTNQTTSGYGYKIEKFILDLATPAVRLVRPNNTAYVVRSSSTKCISSMVIGNK